MPAGDYLGGPRLFNGVGDLKNNQCFLSLIWDDLSWRALFSGCIILEIVASSQRFLRKDAHIGGFQTQHAMRTTATGVSVALPGVSSAALADPRRLLHNSMLIR
jgi:hypothetical protein